MVLTTSDYGRWPSALSAAEVARSKISLADLCSDGTALYWLEARPEENGRVVFVRADTGGRHDHSPAGASIRSRVHEYGGGAVCLVPGHSAGAFAYVDQADQRVWWCDGGADAPEPVTPRALSVPAPGPAPAGSAYRHGGLTATADGHWVLAVREAHPSDGHGPPKRSVVAFSTRSATPSESTVLAGHDFFGAPRVDATAGWLAVVVWDHPDMPWDASLLVVVALTRSDHTLSAAGPPTTVAGGPDESVGQPAWQHDGTLRFVSDRRGWWQPYVHPAPFDERAAPVALSDAAAEYHGPDWVLGQATMAEMPGGAVVARQTSSGRDAVVRLHPGGAPEVVAQPCVSIAGLCAHGDDLAIVGSTPDAPSNVWIVELGEAGAAPRPARPPRPLRPAPSFAVSLAPDTLARGEPFTLTGRSGRPVHGTLYRPAGQRDHGGAAGGPPPLVTWCHSGPTSASQRGLDLTLQFFTTRGFAVACVDYAGSSGYGRAYRDALRGLWGVADAEDCLDAARHLGERGDVDAGRMAVRGGSAGGMTALNALAAGEGFAACTASYGVTDLVRLVATTHDFEAHYTDRLIGPLPEAEPLFVERSPVSRAASIRGAVLLLQGTEDAVVPPAQAERMRDALVAAGTPCDLRFFAGEGHGFRRADTLTTCLEAELSFYLAELRL